MKKASKTTRPFWNDVNQIPYNYTVEVANRFKGLDLIDRGPEELWAEVSDIVQEAGITPSQENKRQNGCLRRPYKQLRKEEKQRQRRKGNIYPSECRVPKNRKGRKERLPKLTMQRNKGK